MPARGGSLALFGTTLDERRIALDFVDLHKEDVQRLTATNTSSTGVPPTLSSSAPASSLTSLPTSSATGGGNDDRLPLTSPGALLASTTISTPALTSSPCSEPLLPPLPPTIGDSLTESPTKSATGGDLAMSLVAASTSSATLPHPATGAIEEHLPVLRSPPVLTWNPLNIPSPLYPLRHQQMSERAIELGCYPTAGTYVVNDRVRRDFRLDIEGLHEELYHDSDIDEFYHREWRVPGEFDEDQDRIFDVEQGRVTESTGDTGLLRHRLGRQISSSSSSSSGGDSGQTLINKLVYDIHTMLIKDTQRAKRILNEERVRRADSEFDIDERERKACNRWKRLGILAILLLFFHGAIILITWRLLKGTEHEGKIFTYIALCWFCFFLVFQLGKFVVDSVYDFVPSRMTELFNMLLHGIAFAAYYAVEHIKIGDGQHEIKSIAVAHTVAYLIEIIGAVAIQYFCKADVDINPS